MDVQAKLQQKWACLVSETGPFLKSHWHIFKELGSTLGFTEDEFTNLLKATGFVKCAKEGTLGFSVDVFESAIFTNEDANADVQLVRIPIAHDNLSGTKGDFKNAKLSLSFTKQNGKIERHHFNSDQHVIRIGDNNKKAGMRSKENA